MKHYTGNKKVDSLISDAVHRRIVPELLRKNISGSVSNTFSPFQHAFDDIRIEDFCEILSTGEEAAAFRQFDLYLGEGISVSKLFIDLLSNAARRLGELWGEDSCSFGDVTVGMAILHNIVRSYAPRLAHELKADEFKGSIYVAPMPGQMHIFGSFMLETFLSAAGWNVKSGLPKTREEFLNEFSTHDYSAIAITVSDIRDVVECKQLIKNIRNMSLNTDVKVLVGGPLFNDGKMLFKKLGADATASNALEALEVIKAICKEELYYGRV